MKRLGKDYFKKTSIAMGLIHLFMICVFGYCLVIMLLPSVAKWVFESVLWILEKLSMGNEDWYLFNVGFFFTCFGGLVLAGIVINIIDYINYRKEMKSKNISD